MRRREFIRLVGGGAAIWSTAARSQKPDRIRVIGVLMGWADDDPATQPLVAEFRDVLAKLGWTVGRNLRIELRWGDGDAVRIEALAKELVNLKPDVILGQSTPVVGALARETQTIPIVFV